MTRQYDAGLPDRYHSKFDHNCGYRRGDGLFYGFAFRLSDSWQFQDQPYNIAQFIANRPGTGCGGDDWMPSVRATSSPRASSAATTASPTAVAASSPCATSPPQRGPVAPGRRLSQVGQRQLRLLQDLVRRQEGL